MTPELKEELIAFGNKYFSFAKQNWTPEELGEIYNMYNKLNGTDKKDQGCGSCRRETIRNVRDAWIQTQVAVPPAARF